MDQNVARVGFLIGALRRTKGISLADMAEKIGKTESTLSSIEADEIVPNIYTLQKACTILDVGVKELYDDTAIEKVAPEHRELHGS